MNNDGIHSLLNADLMDVAGAPSQGARRATVEGAGGRALRRPDPEVVATAKRRQFPMSEKRRIVAAADACERSGELGALLRKEGIYSSMLSTWRKQVAREKAGAQTPRRGRKADPARAEKVRIEKLEREKARLERELVQARLIIDVQKKVAALLGVTMPPAPPADEE